MGEPRSIATIAKDGWKNLLTGVGIKARDKRASSKHGFDKPTDQKELNSIYRANGFGARIVNLVADEMTREWIEVDGDTDNILLGQLEDMDAQEKFSDILRWSRLYGGAIGVMIIDDGQELSDPVNESSIRSVEAIHVFDRHEVSITADGYYEDPENPKYGEIQKYDVTPAYGSRGFTVHESRVLRMDGLKLSSRDRVMNNSWGDSVLQPLYQQLQDLGMSITASANIIEDFVTMVLSVENLQNLIASGQEDVIHKRLQIIDMGRHVMNTVMLDANEQYEKKASTVTGLDQLLDRFALFLSASSGIPYSLLMGQAPAGLNATGDSDIRFFYDKIASDQRSKMLPQLRKLVNYIAISKDSKFSGATSEISIKFRPLWQMTDAQKVALRKDQSETDQRYYDMNVLTEDEIRNSRFGGNSYSSETELDQTNERPDVPE